MPSHRKLAIAELNRLDREGFVAALDGIFEGTPEVARRAFAERPFADAGELLAAMRRTVMSFSPDAKVALLRAHPKLGSRGPMASHSAAEQRGAGLQAMDRATGARLRELNEAYERRFGFPFVIAVKGLGPAEILASLAQRLENEPAAEMASALEQVCVIAGYRLRDRVTETAGRA